MNWRLAIVGMVGVLISVPSLTLFYWILDTTPPVRVIHSEQTRIVDADEGERPAYFPGEKLKIWRGVCVDRRVTGAKSRRWLENRIVVRFSDMTVIRREVGTCVSTWYPLELPLDLSPGEWTYHVESDYRLNPLSTATVVWPTVTFRVTRKPEKRVEALEQKVQLLEKKIDHRGLRQPPQKVAPEPAGAWQRLCGRLCPQAP